MNPPPGNGNAAANDEGYVASVADFAHLYTDRPTRLLYLCEFILFNSSGSPPNEQLLYHTLLELYLADQLVDQDGEAGVNAAEVLPQVKLLGQPLLLAKCSCKSCRMSVIGATSK
jgi:hypothetical protein